MPKGLPSLVRKQQLSEKLNIIKSGCALNVDFYNVLALCKRPFPSQIFHLNGGNFWPKIYNVTEIRKCQTLS
jgi:hypothetical protein